MSKYKLCLAFCFVCFFGVTSCRQHRTPKKISFTSSKPSRHNNEEASLSHTTNSITAQEELSLANIVSGTSPENILLQYTGFVVSYNTNTSTPSWVAWELTAAETTGNISRKDYDFIPDLQLDETYRVEKADYKDSGYDRGHMCPAGDMEWSSSAMYDCHYMTNICPQAPKLNQVYWERLESACRRWAKLYDSIYIVCGPIYKKGNANTIGITHSISVPDAFFKVVVSLNEPYQRGIGFVYLNNNERQTMENSACTIDEIEGITGLDFFSELPDSLEEELESQNRLNAWR